MSNNTNFFPSLKGDKGLTVKINKKNQITITFIGDKGPLTVLLDKENSQAFVEHLQKITTPVVPPQVNEEAPIEIKSANLFIEETLRNLNTPWSAGYDMSPPLTKELDTKDHPFVRGHGNISEELNGED
tara:strand:+ start:174 stop:560 length:387 start_codon:yes stop_codon:yes gene_type:complete